MNKLLGKDDTDESLDHWSKHGYSFYDDDGTNYYDYTEHESFIG